MGLFSYLFASDNTRSLMKIEKVVKLIEEKADVYSEEKKSGVREKFEMFFKKA